MAVRAAPAVFASTAEEYRPGYLRVRTDTQVSGLLYWADGYHRPGYGAQIAVGLVWLAALVGQPLRRPASNVDTRLEIV